MKVAFGLYTVRVGYAEPGREGEVFENWTTHTVRARTATEAIEKMKLNEFEFISQVVLLGREG